MRQIRENANRNDTGIEDVQAEHNKRNFRTENLSPPHTRRVKTHGERKLVYQDDIEPRKITSVHTHRNSQLTKLYKSTKATEAWLNDQAPSANYERMPTAIQRLGSLNFTPINPGNVIQEYHKECKGQTTATNSETSTLAPNPEETQTTVNGPTTSTLDPNPGEPKTTLKQAPPMGMITLEVHSRLKCLGGVPVL